MKKRIFVTVGTGEFEELVKEMDKIAEEIDSEILIQIGKGKYEPKNCKFFRFHPNLEEFYKLSWLVIAHGGAGTTYELLRLKKKVVSLCNLNRTDTHQYEILKELSEKQHLLWCKNPKKIREAIKTAAKFKFKNYEPPKCKIPFEIEKFMKELA